MSTAVRTPAPGPAPAAAAPAIAVGCLGTLRLSADGAELPWRPVRRGRAVFQYLLAHRERPVARDELADVFWPGSGASAARNCLNTALSILRGSLREVLGELPVVVHRDGAYALDAALDLTVDAEAFEALAPRGRACAARATPRERPAPCGRRPASTRATCSPTTPTRTGWRPAGATCARPT
jgi:hypothetical protein